MEKLTTKGTLVKRNHSIKRSSQSLTSSEALELGNENENSYGKETSICVSYAVEDFIVMVYDMFQMCRFII